ncbi:thioredoxin-related transmembrane protein 2 homolog [Pectinophora gossypiella]|uniref:thioredoxin-related transmembrane protein 2 homolog n=1 Tax=Pectinophora gossypiella TaxID=13191 RepID=UPI00214E1166|nr:thioredoxin-related transmembrane protein 2 homolog [Pectinophora gossypiella]
MSFKADFRQILKPYYWVNILLSLSYVTCKRTALICNFLFPSSDCELDTRETEILFFLIIVVMLRTRKAGSVTMVNYLSSSFVYTKIANLILWFYADIRYGLPYGALLILTALLLPEPTYSGPEHITYFRGPQTLEDELKRNKHVTWVVCVYAAWHPACVNFAPVFAELSASYSLDNLKFGKLDVGRYPDAATKYRVQDGPTSRQLPTVLLLGDGVEKMRRPNADHSGKLLKFLFSKDNVKAAFDLDGIYQECKERLSTAKICKKTEKTE